eukprot:2100881-Rhodomonas_salina.1
MSGTDLASVAILRLSSTDRAYDATMRCPALDPELPPLVASPLSSYACAMQCPVLPYDIVLCLSYAMSGTVVAYRPMPALRNVRYCHSTSSCTCVR